MNGRSGDPHLGEVDAQFCAAVAFYVDESGQVVFLEPPAGGPRNRDELAELTDDPLMPSASPQVPVTTGEGVAPTTQAGARTLSLWARTTVPMPFFLHDPRVPVATGDGSRALSSAGTRTLFF